MLNDTYDATLILNEAMKYARKLKKQKTEETVEPEKTKIAILGSYSIQFFRIILQYMLHKEGIETDVYEGDYNGIDMALLDPESEFYKFQADVVIILPYHEDVKTLPNPFEQTESIDKKIDSVISHYADSWKRINDRMNCHILQANFVIPNLTSLGILESNYEFSYTHFLKKINLLLEEKRSSNVTIIDMDQMASRVGKNNWFDHSAYFMNKAGFSMDHMPYAVKAFVDAIKALGGKIRKCLVLDLDNTLWGGVVAECNYDGIILDPNQAEGEAYRAFQQYILNLRKRGVILAVCSKNDEPVAKEPFEKNENMILHLSDISCFTANWNDKVSNIKLIARELNIGTDSMVFVDDNPAEREIVRQFMPEVLVVDLPEDVAYYRTALEEASAFDWIQITKDDISRTEYYVEGKKREDFLMSFSDYDDYLQALEMEGNVYDLDESNIPRFVQLINKSNQFNLRTRRYNEAEIRSMISDDQYALLFVKIKDRFSDYGLISCVILKKVGMDCYIDTWLMSCRVLKRKIENMVCERIREVANEWQCTSIIGEYIPTAKNGMVSKLYEELGFESVDTHICKTSEESRVYVLKTDSDNKLNYYIKHVE